jgi:formylglycine-generating enzyme required for sulfatase activity
MRLSPHCVAAALILPACGGAPSRAPELAGAAPVARASPSGVAADQTSPIGRMAGIPSATFRMGSEAGEPDEAPVHSVRVAAFDLDVTEVTVANYASCVKAGACLPAAVVVQWPGVTGDDQQVSKDICNGNRPDRQDHAVNCVDWNMADAYCRWAGKRLPTEEEWEYAACGGVCNEETGGPKLRAALATAARWPFTSRVASGPLGPFGLYDMTGNVWEWTASTYCPYDHPGCGDPRRVVRGGSWSMIDYLFVRLTNRSASVPSTRNTNLGFRCARSPGTDTTRP